jgi:hypothetical protein
VAYFDGDVTAAEKTTTTGWTINPSWDIKTGGVWATETINKKYRTTIIQIPPSPTREM